MGTPIGVRDILLNTAHRHIEERRVVDELYVPSESAAKSPTSGRTPPYHP